MTEFNSLQENINHRYFTFGVSRCISGQVTSQVLEFINLAIFESSLNSAMNLCAELLGL